MTLRSVDLGDNKKSARAIMTQLDIEGGLAQMCAMFCKSAVTSFLGTFAGAGLTEEANM